MPTEILPGIWHWSTLHKPIGAHVSSAFIAPAGLIIDPKIPDEGLDALAQMGTPPSQIALTSGNHNRDAEAIAARFDVPILTSQEGADRLAGRLAVETYTDHDEIAPGVTAIRIGVLSGDEYALHIAHGDGALAIADGLTHYAGALGFFADDLLGEDPEAIKEGLKHRFGAQLQRDFDALLFAHGDPIVKDAKSQLRAFVTSAVGHEEFGQAL